MTHLSLRDIIARAIGDAIATGAGRAVICDTREIDRLADALVAVLEKVPVAGVAGWTVIQPGLDLTDDAGDAGKITSTGRPITKGAQPLDRPPRTQPETKKGHTR